VSVLRALWRAVLAAVDAGFRAFRFARRHSRLLDHASSAWTWLDDCRGSRLAAYISYYGLLSLFPILALVLGAITLITAHSPRIAQSAHDLVQRGLSYFLPGVDESTFQTGATGRISELESHGLVTVLLGIVVLFFTGSGWISAQREAIRTVFETGAKYDRFFLVAKGADILVLLQLGVILAVSVAITTFGSTRTQQLTTAVGLGSSTASTILVRVIVIALGIVTGTVLFQVQHRTLSGLSGRSNRAFLPGAIVAALGFEILKQLATLVIGHTLHNELYGAFAVIAAVLVWINLTSRVSLYGAAWTVVSWRRKEASRAAAAAAAELSRARRPAPA
jgi:membrane protein